MAKEVLRNTDTDRAVDRWLREVPHSLNEVISYHISKGVNQFPVIELKMFFDEPPRSPFVETASIDQPVREFLPTEKPKEE